MAMWNTIKIGWKADLVVACVDSVTGRIIQDATLQVWSPDRPRPVRKPDGYYVFLGCGQGVLSVRIQSPFFQDASLEQELPDPAGSLPVRWVRLMPNRRYPFPEGTAFLEGTAAPGSRIAVTGGQPVRLGENYKKGSEVIRLHLPEDTRLDGAAFAVTVKGQGTVEELRLEETLEEGHHRLEVPLKKDHSMAQTVLLPVWETTVAEDGRFWLAVPGGLKSQVRCSCLAPGAKRAKEKELTLEESLTEVDF